MQPCDIVSIVLVVQEELDEDVELTTSKPFTVCVVKQFGQQFSPELVRSCKDCNGLPAFQLLPLYEIVLSMREQRLDAKNAATVHMVMLGALLVSLSPELLAFRICVCGVSVLSGCCLFS